MDAHVISSWWCGGILVYMDSSCLDIGVELGIRILFLNGLFLGAFASRLLSAVTRDVALYDPGSGLEWGYILGTKMGLQIAHSPSRRKGRRHESA